MLAKETATGYFSGFLCVEAAGHTGGRISVLRSLKYFLTVTLIRTQSLEGVGGVISTFLGLRKSALSNASKEKLGQRAFSQGTSQNLGVLDHGMFIRFLIPEDSEWAQRPPGETQ